MFLNYAVIQFQLSIRLFFSSRPHTAATEIDEHISPQKLMTQSPLSVKETLRKAKQEMEDRGDMSSLIYHTSDFTVTSIVDNPKVGISSGIRIIRPSLKIKEGKHAVFDQFSHKIVHWMYL